MRFLRKVYFGIMYHTGYVILSYDPGPVQIWVWLRSACTFSTQDLSASLASVHQKVSPLLPFAHFFLFLSLLLALASLSSWVSRINSQVWCKMEAYHSVSHWHLRGKLQCCSWERRGAELERSPGLLPRVVWPDTSALPLLTDSTQRTDRCLA